MLLFDFFLRLGPETLAQKTYSNLEKRGEKKDFEFHLPAQPSAPSSFPTTSHVGLQPARTGLMDRPSSAWGPPVLLSVLLGGALTAVITQCCCTLRL